MTLTNARVFAHRALPDDHDSKPTGLGEVPYVSRSPAVRQRAERVVAMTAAVLNAGMHADAVAGMKGIILEMREAFGAGDGQRVLRAVVNQLDEQDGQDVEVQAILSCAAEHAACMPLTVETNAGAPARNFVFAVGFTAQPLTVESARRGLSFDSSMAVALPLLAAEVACGDRRARASLLGHAYTYDDLDHLGLQGVHDLARPTLAAKAGAVVDARELAIDGCQRLQAQVGEPQVYFLVGVVTSSDPGIEDRLIERRGLGRGQARDAISRALNAACGEASWAIEVQSVGLVQAAKRQAAHRVRADYFEVALTGLLERRNVDLGECFWEAVGTQGSHPVLAIYDGWMNFVGTLTYPRLRAERPHEIAAAMAAHLRSLEMRCREGLIVTQVGGTA